MRFLWHIVTCSIVAGAIFIASLFLGKVHYEADAALSKIALTQLQQQVEEITTPVQLVQHIATPPVVRAIYLSKYGAASTKLREPALQLVDDTEINAVIIDIKDYTGKISFITDDPDVLKYGMSENIITDIVPLIQQLHDKGVYVIGRVSVFQDGYAAKKFPQFAVHDSAGNLWKDRKGQTYFDPASREVWDYTVAIAEMAYNLGFDEINVDYVRFPSDGNMKDIVFPVTGNRLKSDVIKEFFVYLNNEIMFKRGIPLSADVFGMTTTNYDDLGIGQVFENIAPYVTAIAPMIYPSHYPKTFHGYDNPAAHPYEIITIASKGALDRLADMAQDSSKYRPWLQDFNLGAIYTSELVSQQIRALEDLGVYSWMMWDPSNTYTRAAYIEVGPYISPTELPNSTREVSVENS